MIAGRDPMLRFRLGDGCPGAERAQLACVCRVLGTPCGPDSRACGTSLPATSDSSGSSVRHPGTRAWPNS